MNELTFASGWNALIPASGCLRYSIGNEGYKLILEVDPELARYTRSLIPKSYNVQQSRYAPHITVVRKEKILNEVFWGHLDGYEIAFAYDPVVCFDDTYFWLRCWSYALTSIRLKLGLELETEYTRPPDGESCFHITVGNCKKQT